MMTSRKLLDRVTAEPYRPFTIHMASGESFEIRHPENVQVGRTTATIQQYCDVDGVSQSSTHEISVLLIESIESADSQSVS